MLVQDWGHAGIRGYLYCEGQLPEIHGDPYFDVDAPGPMAQVGSHLASGWWSVYCDLD